MNGLEVERRAVLIAPAAAIAGLALDEAGTTVARIVEAGAEPGLVWIARFLTGRPRLSSELVARAINAIGQTDADFAAKVSVLADRIKSARMGDVEAFRTSSLARDPAMMGTAVALIRALYIGSVGKGWAGRPISYEEALMFAPTCDVTVIPTYARAGPGNWAQPVTRDA